MVLIISTPFSLAETDFIKTYEPEDIFEGQYTDLIINVGSYEPTIIRSSLIEEKDTPVFVHLMGVPTHPGIGFPRIQSLSVSELNKSKYIKGVRYKEPMVYSWDDLGILEVWLKKIEKEKDVPDRIDLDLRAKVRYEADVTSTVVGGEQTRDFDEQPWLTINDVLRQSKEYGIFGNKGYISLYSVNGKSATFVIRNSAGKLLGYLSVTEDQDKEISLVQGSKKPEDYVRVRANIVLDGSKPHAWLSINNQDYPIMAGDSLDGWRIYKIDKVNEVILLERNKVYSLLTKGGKEEALKYFSDHKSDIKVEINSKNIDEFFREFPNLEVKSISGGEPLIAKLNIGGTIVDLKENQNINDLCKIAKITENYVIIEHPEYSGKTQSRLDVLTAEEKMQQTTSKYKRRDTLSSPEICRQDVTLDHIIKGGWVEVALSSGRRKGYTTTDFSLHLPIEKRGINLSPRALDKHINMTKKWIEQLDKAITNLENFLTVWEKVCFATLAFTTIWNFFVPKAEKPEIKEEVKTGVATDYDKKVRKATIGDESAIIVPIENIENLPEQTREKIKKWIESREGLEEYAVHTPGGSAFYEGLEGIKWVEPGKGYEVYAVRTSNEVVFYKRIEGIDIGQKVEEGEGDMRLFSISRKLLTAEYNQFTNNFIKPFSEAVSKGQKTFVGPGNVKYSIGDDVKQRDKGVDCKEVMPPLLCKLLFEACDPVMCPTDRCDLGGTYPVENVIQSGLIGSLTLCLGNFGPHRNDGVTIPFCLSGILASLKNIRSYVKEYNKCLIMAKAEGKTVGVCDKIRSIFMCEVLWREVITPLVDLKGGILTKIFSGFGLFGGGGESYLKGGFERATDTVSWFTQDYAKTIFAAYKSKSTQEIGSELCRSYVGGKFPSLGKFISELAKPEDPYQFTAEFTEEPYAPTQQKSQYSVYYHIYAGTPKVEEKLRYSIRLRASGIVDYVVAQGLINPGDSASETIDFVATSGYQEICVEINGRPYCNIGKTVSTSFGVNKLMEELMESSLSKKITKESQCVSTVGSILIPGQLQGVAVERQCAVENPGLGFGLEDQWRSVGFCNEGKTSICYQRSDENRYPQIKYNAAEKSCENMGGKYCGAGTYCESKEKIIDTVYGRDCCTGTCKFYIQEEVKNELTHALELFGRETKERKIAEVAVENTKGDSVLLGLGVREEGEFEGDVFNDFHELKKSSDLDIRYAYHFLKGIIYIKYGKLDKAENSIADISNVNEQSRAYIVLIKAYSERKMYSKVLEIASKIQNKDYLSSVGLEIETAETESKKKKGEAEKETKKITCPELNYNLGGIYPGLPVENLQSSDTGMMIKGVSATDNEECGWACACKETGKWECSVSIPCVPFIF